MENSKSFDEDLFYRLFEKYSIDLTDKYDKSMLGEVDDIVRSLTDEDVLNLSEVGK